MKILALFLSIILFLPTLVLANSTLIKLNPQGDDEYTLEFENRQAARYKIPYITNEGGLFKYGDNNDDLVYTEAEFDESKTLQELAKTNHTFNIGLLDYFVLSNQNPSGYDENATTHIVRYTSIDTSDRTITFNEKATRSVEFTYETGSYGGGTALGKADLIFSGNTYVTYIANVTERGGDNPLAIDMNGDGNIDSSEIRITTKSGSILDLGEASESHGGQWNISNIIKGTATWSNTGRNLKQTSSPFTLLTKQGLVSGFPTQDETVTTIIETRTNNEIGIEKITGSNFILQLQLPTTSAFFTKYGADFMLQRTLGNAEQLTITQALALTPTLTIQGEPRIGNTINITPSYRPHLGQDYLFMLSTSTTPPYMLTNGRTIPLQPNSIMHTSMYYPTRLGLIGSQNKLNPLGNGQVLWTIPDVSSIVGLDVHFVFVTTDFTKPMPQTVQAISPATKITILDKQ